MPDPELNFERDALKRFALNVVIFVSDRLERERLQPGPQFNHRPTWIAVHCPDPQYPGGDTRRPGGSHLVIRGSKRKPN
jgi:hypothetical protein